MFSAIFPHLRKQRSRGSIAVALANSLNDRRYRKTRSYLTEDVVFSDVSGHTIRGADGLIEMVDRFRQQAHWPEIIIESVDHSDGDVLLRGRLDTHVPEVSGDTYWRISFEGSLISAIEVTRANGNMTVPQFAARYA